MAAPTLETNAGADTLRILDGTSGNPVTWDDVWDWDDGGGSSGGDGDVPKDGGGTAKVSTFMTEIVTDAIYTIQKNIDIGDGSTSTYFTSLNEMVYFEDGFKYQVTTAAILQRGDLVGDFGVDGSTWSIGPGANIDLIANGQTGTILDYASVLHVRDGSRITLYGTFTNVKSQYLKAESASNLENLEIRGTSNITDSYFAGWGSVLFYVAPTTLVNYHIHNCTFGLRSAVGGAITFTGAKATSCGTGRRTLADTVTSVNPLESSAGIRIDNASGNWTDALTTNIHISDRDGLDLATATVACESFGNIVSPDAGANFYKCLLDHTAGTFATDLAAGKWELTTAANAAKAGVTGAAALTGAWVTATDYVKSAELFSVATDAAGDIAQQTIDYKKWEGTSEPLQSLAPYTFTISKATYATLVEDDVEPLTIGGVVQPLVEHWELLPYLDPASVEITVEYGEDLVGTLIIPTAVAPGGDFEAILRAWLAAAATLTDETGTRIYVDEFPEGFTIDKALLLRESSGSDQPNVLATEAFVEFLCVGATLKEAKEVYIALHAVLRATNNVTMSGKKVWWNEKTFGPVRLDDPDTDWPTVQVEYRFRVEE